MAKVYGYVLLPVAFETPTTGGQPTQGRIDETVEALWDKGEFDLEGMVEHYHSDGGFAPTFVEASNEYEGIQQLVKLRSKGL